MPKKGKGKYRRKAHNKKENKGISKKCKIRDPDIKNFQLFCDDYPDSESVKKRLDFLPKSLIDLVHQYSQLSILLHLHPRRIHLKVEVYLYDAAFPSSWKRVSGFSSPSSNVINLLFARYRFWFCSDSFSNPILHTSVKVLQNSASWNPVASVPSCKTKCFSYCATELYLCGLARETKTDVQEDEETESLCDGVSKTHFEFSVPVVWITDIDNHKAPLILQNVPAFSLDAQLFASSQNEIFLFDYHAEIFSLLEIATFRFQDLPFPCLLEKKNLINKVQDKYWNWKSLKPRWHKEVLTEVNGELYLFLHCGLCDKTPAEYFVFNLKSREWKTKHFDFGSIQIEIEQVRNIVKHQNCIYVLIQKQKILCYDPEFETWKLELHFPQGYETEEPSFATFDM